MTVADPYAELRGQLEAGIRDAVALIDNAYRERIERAHERGWDKTLSGLLNSRSRDIEVATKGFVVEYARLPPPPIVIKTEDLSPEMRERFGL